MTSPSARRIAAAKAESIEARMRFLSTAAALQQRLKPGSLASQAWTEVKEKGGEIADDAVEAVKHRPAVASGVAAAFLLYLAREPIISAASRLMNGEERSKKRPDKGEQSAPARTRRKNEGVSA